MPPAGLDRVTMDDQIDSGEGPEAPSKQKPMRRRRSRKLSGSARAAMGELAFCVYSACGADVPDALRWQMLNRMVRNWAARYL